MATDTRIDPQYDPLTGRKINNWMNVKSLQELSTVDSIIEKKINKLLNVEAYTPSSANPDRELSFGERAVGLQFNPGGNPQVYSVKSQMAGMIDALNLTLNLSTDSQKKRICEIAIAELMTAQMWMIKALTFSDK